MDHPTQIRQMNFRYLLISQVLVSFLFSIQMNTLPLYVLKFGGNAVHVGMITGVASITALFFRVISGHLLDQKGRVLVYFTGVCLYILSTIGYIFAPNVAFLLVSRVICGIGLSAVTSSIGAIAADLMPANLTNALYNLYVIQIFGGLFAPTLGIFTANAVGYRQLYVFTAIGYLFVLYSASRLKYEKQLPRAHAEIVTNVLRPRGVSSFIEISALYPALCMTFHGIAGSSIIGFIASYGKTIGIDNIGFFFIINGLITFMISPLLKRFSAIAHNNKVFTIGVFAFISGLALFLFSKGPLWIAAAAVFYTAGFSATQPILNSLALSMAPAHRKGAANATYYIFWDFGFGGGSMLLGAVAARFGYPCIYGIGIVSLLVMLFIYWRRLSACGKSVVLESPAAS